MAEFLLEILSEEIPARMQVRAKEDLGALVCKVLDEAELSYGKVETFATPRRLVLIIDDLATQQPDIDVERKGPRVGAPEKAIEGFKRSLGAESYELSEEQDKKGAFYVARFRKVGRPTADLLAELLPDVLKNFPWPKSMRWGDHDVRWVRPLHGILSLLDGAAIPFTFGPVTAGNISHGHRFHAPEPFEAESVAQYKKELARRFVVLDREERRAGIEGQADLIAKQHGLRLRDDLGLLDEVTGLVEWPVAVCGSIDATFMELPPEVLVTSMRAHQKYLALEDESGALAAKFVAIANLEAKDGGEAIVAGNERVLRARLWDAKFFWDQDGRRPLADLLPKLDDIVFHAKLGSLGDKVRRIETLAGWLADRIHGADPSAARAAARLAKADLVSGMVGEFPELQGLMGRYYAEKHGESEEVSHAIGEHYAPEGPNDDCPKAPVSVAVALADKLDTLAGFFAIDEKPTGSKDPFALRRAALGVIRLILENQARLPLRDIFSQALTGYGQQLEVEEQPVVDELLTFFGDRLKVYLRTSGVRHDLIAAVFVKGDDDLVRILKRVEALEKFLSSDDGASLLTGYRRATNILRIEEKKDGRTYREKPDYNVLDADKLDVNVVLLKIDRPLKECMVTEQFEGALAHLIELRSPIDAFFESVVVNSEDNIVRENRLRLLNRIRTAFDEIADFSQIEDVVTENNNRRVA